MMKILLPSHETVSQCCHIAVKFLVCSGIFVRIVDEEASLSLLTLFFLTLFWLVVHSCLHACSMFLIPLPW